MGKYVYFDKHIWLCERFDSSKGRGRRHFIENEKLFVVCEEHYDEDDPFKIRYTWYEHPHYKISDDFEGLVQAGDLIQVEHTSTFGKNWTAFEIVDDITIEEVESGYYNSENKWMTEIYKHEGKDFIRVCHKEEESWVID